MADEPVIAQKAPYRLEMQPGTYYWCRCGRSAKQPFCDGSHKGTGLAPLKVDLTDAQTISWCGCKHSRTEARCDGTHHTL